MNNDPILRAAFSPDDAAAAARRLAQFTLDDELSTDGEKSWATELLAEDPSLLGRKLFSTREPDGAGGPAGRMRTTDTSAPEDGESRSVSAARVDRAAAEPTEAGMASTIFEDVRPLSLVRDEQWFNRGGAAS